MDQINWKYILIVAVLAAIVGGVTLQCAQLRQELSYGPTVAITTSIPTSTPTPAPSVTPTPDEKAAYWLNTEGELWKKEEQTSTALVSAERDMEETATQVNYSSGEPIFHKKGEVLDFLLSPDENYIAYTTLEYFTSCCMNPPTAPVASLYLMKNDGTEKTEIEKPQGIRDPLLVVDGWIPNSDRLLFHYQAPDAGTSHSLYFEVSPTEKTPKLYTEIFKFFKEGVEIDPKDVSADDMDTMYLDVFNGRR